MCHGNKKDNDEIKAHYIAEDVFEIQLPIENLPELGDRGEEGIIAYILISNGEEITLINNEEEYQAWIDLQNWNGTRSKIKYK